MLIFLLLLFAMCCVSADAASDSSEPSARSDSLLFMSFNVRFANPKDGANVWENRRDLLYSFLRQRKPDILGTQEALASQIEDILNALPDYEVVAVGRDDGIAKGEHCAIFYRRDRVRPLQTGAFWLSETPSVPGSKGWDANLPRICTWADFLDKRTGKAFCAYNLHTDDRSQKQREMSAEIVLKTIRERVPARPSVVMGDFNAGEENPAIQAMRAAPDLFDTFRALHPDEKVVGTYNDFKGRADGDKIDYLFASREFEATDAQILRDSQDGRYPSDHFPITARLIWAHP